MPAFILSSQHAFGGWVQSHSWTYSQTNGQPLVLTCMPASSAIGAVMMWRWWEACACPWCEPLYLWCHEYRLLGRQTASGLQPGASLAQSALGSVGSHLGISPWSIQTAEKESKEQVSADVCGKDSNIYWGESNEKLIFSCLCLLTSNIINNNNNKNNDNTIVLRCRSCISTLHPLYNLILTESCEA